MYFEMDSLWEVRRGLKLRMYDPRRCGFVISLFMGLVNFALLADEGFAELGTLA